MTNPAQEAQRLGQSIWYDNIQRELLVSGEMRRLIEQGVTGVTSNPTIFEKAIAGSADYDDALRTLAADGKDVPQIYEALVMEDIRATADLLRDVYESTGGADGYVSLEVSPALARDTQGTVEEAHRLFADLDRPNVMVKVPATPQGIPAVRRLIGAGVNVNVTLIFSRAAHRQVMEAYIAGLEELDHGGGDVSKVASVASFFVSRVDTAVDNLLEGLIQQGDEEAEELLGRAAVANAKLAYQAFRSAFNGARFEALRSKGARVQRPLWASTGTKNPAYSDLLYVESLMGSDTVNTVPPATLTALLDHGVPKPALHGGVDEAGHVMEALEAAGVGMEAVTDRLLEEGVRSFADSFDKLLANIREKKELLLAEEHDLPGMSLGSLARHVQDALEDLQRRDAVGRIWRKDHTLWKPDPDEISDRLGWLEVTELMSEEVPALEAFATEVRDAGFSRVVLLGMGGSSLGPEVLRQTFGSASGYPELIVLDSTVPAWVRAVTETIDPAQTLFLVSSKSGGTIEPHVLYRHFRALVDDALGKDRAGMSFVAVTDADTPLERLGQSEGFRRIFLNPSNIGGRYSVLSYFGLVPAALIGVDVAELLGRAERMRAECAASVPAHANPGAILGAAMGALAQQGRNKLTLVTSPAIADFSLWAEQIIAESTGKEDAGIVPVAGEPLVGPDSYGDDRLFVYLRLDEDANDATDAAMDRIEASGWPALRLRLRDRYDLGAELFRWEFATAISGAVLGIHPFDQPDVQSAKDQTDLVLGEYQSSGRLPEAVVGSSITELLEQARAGDYLAVMAYLRPGPETDQALGGLRRRVMERNGIATTLGYGPRFLHSTGQIHKGGPDTGLFLQLVGEQEEEIPIPGVNYTFGVLAAAQALGDLQVLQGLGRRVVRVRLGAKPEADIARLTAELA